jgi:hypothetical protein
VNTGTKADIDTKFHHLVTGSVGYMAGYLDTRNAAPIAISYLPDTLKRSSSAQEMDPYFYLTRRPFENEKQEKHNLICIGGPEFLMDDTKKYSKNHPYPKQPKKSFYKFQKYLISIE